MGIFDSIKKTIESTINSKINSTTSQTTNKLQHGLENATNKAINKATGVTKTESFSFDKIPATLEEMKALPQADLKSEFGTVALTILAFAAYKTNKEEGIKMLNFLSGPEPLNPTDLQFINTQFMDGQGYVVNSYFEGTSPENNYTPSAPYKFKVIQNPYSRDCINEGYVTLYVQSTGADSPRLVRLRTKKSTGEWFLNDFRALLAGVRLPKEKDAWA